MRRASGGRRGGAANGLFSAERTTLGLPASLDTPARRTLCVPAAVLHSCAHLGHLEAMRQLVQADADVDAAAEDGIRVVQASGIAGWSLALPHTCRHAASFHALYAAMQEVFLQPPNPRFSEAVKRQMYMLLRDAGAGVGARVVGKELTGAGQLAGRRVLRGAGWQMVAAWRRRRSNRASLAMTGYPLP